jgi:hypothetical protein
MEENGTFRIKPCRHLAFFHDTIEGESLYMSDKFRSLTDANEDVIFGWDIFESLKELNVAPSGFHVIETKEDNMACGSFLYVCYYGFDSEQKQKLPDKK